MHNKVHSSQLHQSHPLHFCYRTNGNTAHTIDYIKILNRLKTKTTKLCSYLDCYKHFNMHNLSAFNNAHITTYLHEHEHGQLHEHTKCLKQSFSQYVKIHRFGWLYIGELWLWVDNMQHVHCTFNQALIALVTGPYRIHRSCYTSRSVFDNKHVIFTHWFLQLIIVNR